MKIRHLLLGLMICVAGTGAIDLSGGFLDDQNTTQLTPFLIFGHVLYEGGAPCNNPNVSITNMDTGAAWYADVSADDVLRWSATDGAVVNTTNRTVDQGDLEGSGIFDFDVILQSIAPIIRGYAPESPVYDIEDATRRFNITINQVVDVTWLINSSPAQTDESVTDASYTHTNVAIGVWNISARASNENGTAMQEWIWNVASATAPPPAAPFVVCGRVNYEGGGICEEHAVNITNLNTGTRWQAETRSGYSYYELIPDSADVGTGDVLEFNVTDGVGYNETTRTVTQDDLDRGGLFDLNLTLPVLAPSVGVELTPDDDPVMPGVQVINPDYLTANRTVTITADVTDPDCYENITGVIANITGTGTIGDSPVSLTFVSNSSATTARYIGKFNMSSHPVGDYEVVVNATNTGGFTGTAIRSFTYQYEATAHLPLSPFIIYGSVSYDNGTSCNSPFVAITNLNTSEELIADNRTGEGFYQLVTSSTFANAGDVMRINASKDGSPVGNATYTVNQTEIEHGAIEVDINKRYLPDFTVTNLTFDLSEPLLIGDLVTINAMITNSGESEGNTSVEFYDNKSITIERTRNNYLESPINDTITLPDILRIRVHFESFDASGGNITIYNETQPVEMLGEWTEWCDGDTVRIESWNAMFTVDRYEAVLATNKSITLGEGDSINLSAKWDLSLQEMGWATNGTHNITVRVDPCDQVIESNETNNEETRAIDVHPSLDFAVTEVSLDPSVPVLGDVAEVSANITNYGVRTGTAVVGVYYDNKSMDIGGAVGGVGSNSTDIISLPPGVLGARLHFKQVKIHDGEVAIYDGDGRMVERITHGRWTDWIYGENITIRIELLPQQRRIDSLFDTTNLTWEDDLNNGTVPEELKDLLDEGYDDDYSLSDNATVEKKGEAEEGEAEEGKDEWIIIDGGKERYWIIKESDKLKVYHYYYYGTYKGEFTINRYEALIAEEPVTLNATESKVINASWRTGAAYGGVGYHDLTVVVDPRDTSVETNETNNTLTEQVLVNGTDLTVTAIEMPCGLSLDNLCYVGQDVPVNVTIANIGAIDATNFTVVFLDGNCSDYGKKSINSTPFTEVHIDRLNIGESRNILVVWNPAETGWHMITASIPYDNIDNNGTNNELSGFSRVEPRYDFLVGSVNVEPQKNVRRGESVNITATIGNIGQGGGNVSIGFFVNSTDFAGSCGERFIRIGTIDDVYAEVNETETVSITWDVDVGGGSHLIAAVVNPDNDDDEINGTVYDWSLIRFRGNNTGNNVKTCTLQVLPNNLTITDLTLDPAEPNICDIVDISANITNNGNTTANSTVWFYMEQNSSQRLIHQPEDVMMRVHIAWVEWYNGYLPWSMYAYVNDSHDQRKPVCFYYKDTEGGMVKVPYIMSGPYNGSPPIPCSMIIDNSDDGSRHTYVWKDIWTDWGYGDTFEIKGAPGNCSIDRYQVRLGNETVTLYPDESMTYHGAWNAIPPIKAGEYYRLMANVENRTIYTNETYLGGTDLAITNLSVRSVVYDGDRVWVNATIGNLGRMDATDFIVNFTEVYDPEEVYVGNHADGFEHLELINTTHIEGLDIGNSINISVSWNASIRDIECEGKCYEGVDRIPCNWTETADDYNIRVEINTLENGDKEEDDTNHIREPHVDVDESRDFNVTDLSFYANNKSRDPSKLVIYDDVTLNTTLNITNLANQGGIVDVSFYIDDASAEHKIGNTTVAFPVGGGTGYAEIKWKVENFGDVDVTGEHNMTVVVDPENRIYEIDGDQNTTYIQPIYVMASDLLVESLEFHPESPVRGETASINVTLANHGDANASNLILTIYDWAERHIEDEDEQSGLGRDQIEITRDDATAMRLYLDLEIDGGMVCLNDRSGRGIIHYDKNFHGWTPWVLDNSTTIVVTTNKTHSAYAKVSRVYYLTFSGIIDTSTHDLDVNETKNVTVDWNPSSVGERFVAAIVDPEDCIIESDEFNNRLVEFMSVQAADILVSNLSLAWHNGTEIGEDEIIKDGDDVRISANLSNIGVEDAGSFNVRFLVDDLLIKNEVIGGLVPDELICVSADWSAAVGDRLIKVEVDYVDEIDETNETNNIVAMERYVCGAELSGNTSWKTLGLHGRILFEPTQPYDEDEVVITAIVNNSGYAPAENFSAALFFGYEPDTYYKRMRSYGSTWKLWGELESMRYDDAVCIYLNVSINNGYPILAMYDGNDTEVKRIDKSCWVRVPGDAVRVDCYLPNNYMSSYTIDFYPVYPDNLSQIMKLDVNSSIKLPPIKQNVSVDDYDVILFIDPENKAPEDEDYKEDNVIYKTMHVKPTRDFTVTNVTTLQTNFSDLDTPTIIANVSNIGLRNGTAEVDFVDYEVENRTYKYHFDINRSPSYLPIPPDGNVTLLERCYDNLTIIHRPGVDAIDLHFNRITLPAWWAPAGVISIYDGNGSLRWFQAGGEEAWGCYGDCNIPLVPGETAYIYTNDQASFDLDRYTTETEFHREEVRLNASKAWNESKNVTPIRTAYTGDHTIVATLDGDDKITEINESNNELPSSLFHVNTSRDPAIVGINITPENPRDGDNVDITAVVANNGSKNASFTVDLWANLTRNKPDPDESMPDANLTTNMGGKRIRYITLLNHTTVTLAPGENTTVNATWCDISIDGDPTHHIIAIVDATDEIDEINESNNEIVKRIIPINPDLTIGTAHVHGGTGKVVVPIRNIGASGASNVTVRFESSETETRRKSIGSGWWGSITHLDARNMQVHFEHLRAPDDGCVEVRDSLDLTKPPIATYCGMEGHSWSEWVKGDTVYIVCQGGGTYAEIDEYRWGNVSDTTIDYLPAGGSKSVDMPWPYEYPRMTNVTVDPDNNITEINEGNNEKSMFPYADLNASGIAFVCPEEDKLSLDAEKFVIDGNITNRGSVDGIIVPVSDFDVTLEFRSPNGDDVVFNITEHIEEPLYANEERTITFEFDPSEKFEVGGNYTMRLIADSSNDVRESNELYYPDGEYNNTMSLDVYVHNTSGYTGGGELVNVAQGEVNGRVVYTIGDTVGDYEYGGMISQGGTVTVRYADAIPDDIDPDDIEFARLFLYWYTWTDRPDLAGADMKFNGYSLVKAGNYSDNPGAAEHDCGYGLYSYDVTDYVRMRRL
jgi:subtilase family serine protease